MLFPIDAKSEERMMSSRPSEIDFQTKILDVPYGTNVQSQVSRHVPVAQAIRARKSALSNIWIFDSPKNNKRFILAGDLCFMHLVLLEGNIKVHRYDPDPLPNTNWFDGHQYCVQADVHVQFVDGRIEWWKFQSRQQGNQKKIQADRDLIERAASEAGVIYHIVSEIGLKAKEILFDNWLLLCGAITRARGRSLFRERDVLQSRLDLHGVLQLNSLLGEAEVDPALMLALVAKLLQQGILKTELELEYFSGASLISRSAS